MRYSRWSSATLAAGILFLAASCSRNKPETGEDFRPEPIPVHVVNENFLDMNVAYVTGGVARRLGTVNGNSSGDFKISWSSTTGQPVVMTATPIGGRGSVNSGSLNVGFGQMIEFKIGSVLRQSTAVVREP